MKSKLFKFTLILLSFFILITIYNSLEVHFFRKSLKERFIDETYMRPNFVDEFKKLDKREYADADYDEDTLDELIRNNSIWDFENYDLSAIREDWHYNLFDFLKNKKSGEAEDILKKYIEIKNEQINLISKLEENFININKEFLVKNDNKKDARFYKNFHAKKEAKEKLIRNTNEVMLKRKEELFGDLYEGVKNLNNSYRMSAINRLRLEFQLSSSQMSDLNISKYSMYLEI